MPCEPPSQGRKARNGSQHVLAAPPRDQAHSGPFTPTPPPAVGLRKRACTRFTPAHSAKTNCEPFLARRPPWRIRAIQLAVTPLALSRLVAAAPAARRAVCQPRALPSVRPTCAVAAAARRSRVGQGHEFSRCPPWRESTAAGAAAMWVQPILDARPNSALSCRLERHCVGDARLCPLTCSCLR